MAVTTIAIAPPVSTGFGVMVIDVISGAPESTTTILVTDALFPAPSVAVTTIVFTPSFKVSSVVNPPISLITTSCSGYSFTLTVTLTGADVVSLEVPIKVTVLSFVIKSFTGDVTLNSGGTVSTTKFTVLCTASFPS